MPIMTENHYLFCRIWFVRTENQPTAARQSFALLFLLASADFIFCLSTVPLTAWGLINKRELPGMIHDNIGKKIGGESKLNRARNIGKKIGGEDQ